MGDDLMARLRAAAGAVTEDIMTAIEADPRKVRLVRIELEVASGYQVTDGTAWIGRAVNVNELLTSGGPR